MVMHSFLLIGQSNMAGRGFLTEAPEIDTTHIHILRNGRWQKMFRPVNPDRSFSGTSLAESFAEAYAKKYGVEVGLIPCADGGTSLDQWKEGGLLYDHAVYQARLAQRTSTIAGVLWHQGESDVSEWGYSTYKERFEKLMAAFRRDLDLYDVPFIVGGLGDFLKDFPTQETLRTNYVHVNTALKAIAEANERTGFASAEGLSGNPDNLHFSAAGLYEFGHRYFEEFDKIRDPNKEFHDKSSMDSAIRTAMELL